jgi:Family of unknown function (DUF6049)
VTVRRAPAALGGLLLALGPLLALLLVGAAAPGAAAQESVAVELTSISPTIATSGATVRLAGKVVSASPDALADLTVTLAVVKMNFISDMSYSAGTNSLQVPGVEYPVGQVPAKGSASWSLAVPVPRLGLDGSGVYALDAEAWSQGVRVGAVRTYLPFEIAAGSEFKPTQLALMWPVTAPPVLDGYSDPQSQLPEAVDPANAQLFGELAPNGRLDSVLTSAAKAAAQYHLDVSWVVDPNLVSTVGSEAFGYLLSPNATLGTSNENETAQRWLAEAKTDLGGVGELWQVPATDPDLSSLAQHDPTLAASTVKTTMALASAGESLKTTVGRAPLGTLAWPAGGQADPATLKLAAKSMKQSPVVVQSDSIGFQSPRDVYTPTGRENLSGGQKLAVSDAGLDAIFAGDPADAAQRTAADSSLLASQRLLAQTALIAGQEPNLPTARTILVSPPRDFTPDPALLTALGQASSWVKTVGLSTLLHTAPDPAAQSGTPRRAANPGPDLTQAQLNATAQLQANLSSFSTILTDSGKATVPFNPAILSTLSTQWRTAPGARGAFVQATESRLDSLIGDVSLVQKDPLTLSGKSGSIPFTIQNKLRQPVKVGVRINVAQAGLTTQSVQVTEIPPGSSVVNVPVHASVSGVRYDVTAVLVNSAGADYNPGQSVSVQVTVSSIGSITLVIFGLSAALLVIAVGFRLYRARRTRGGGHPGDPGGASGPGGGTAPREPGE